MTHESTYKVLGNGERIRRGDSTYPSMAASTRPVRVPAPVPGTRPDQTKSRWNQNQNQRQWEQTHCVRIWILGMRLPRTNKATDDDAVRKKNHKSGREGPRPHPPSMRMRLTHLGTFRLVS